MTRVVLTAARRRRLTVAFRTSEAGTATVAAVRGQRAATAAAEHARCGPARGRRAARSASSYGTVSRAVSAGRAKIAIAGRVGRRALPLGTVSVTLIVRDAAGNRSRAIVRSVRVKR